MTKVWIVRVRDWVGDNYVNFSVHKTEKGAEKAIPKANERYSSTSAYVDEYAVEE